MHPHMTVAEALGAHASAQIARARAADELLRTATTTEAELVITESRSFVETWAVQATVIGVRSQ
jgi:c-di-AMP phosphodiesterase-like protein